MKYDIINTPDTFLYFLFKKSHRKVTRQNLIGSIFSQKNLLTDFFGNQPLKKEKVCETIKFKVVTIHKMIEIALVVNYTFIFHSFMRSTLDIP